MVPLDWNAYPFFDKTLATMHQLPYDDQ